MSDKLTAKDLADAIGSRKTRELLGMDKVGDVKPKKRHKYGVCPADERTCDGIVFHSKHEMDRYNILKLLAASGQIRNFKRQVNTPLHGKSGAYIGDYIADFTYFENGELVVEDAKGVRTALYKWKKKMFEAEYGIKIRET